jgi:sensor histidine kinase YesM
MATRDLEIRKLQIRFDTERIEKENILLLQENKLKEAGIRQSRYVIVLLIILAVFIIISGWIILRQSRMKNLHEKVMLEQKLLRAQMNPHFIFNSLASIQNFIIKQDDMNASIYLSHFSDLVRNILEHSAYENIPLEKEINTINNYLELQKLRFRDKFAYTISIDDQVDTGVLEVPPMLVQPFIENAIEHGIRHKNSTGLVTVEIKQEKGNLVIIIEDDGVGREKAKEIESSKYKEHQSMATQITRERLASLNRKLKNKVIFEIIDLKDQSGNGLGTRVNFTLPCSNQS